MGKHAGQPSRRSRWVWLGAAAVGAGLVIAGVVWIFATAFDHGSPEAGGAGATTSATTTSATSGSTSSTAQRALTTCRAHVAAEEKLAQAAQVTARDWSTHTAAQLKLDSGDWTVAQAEEAWATSRQGGDTHTKAFDEARTALTDGPGGAGACDEVVTVSASTPLADEAKACAARDKALAAVASTAAVLNSQWKAHLEMMADKPHTDAAAYHDRWVRMVAEARAPLDRYAAAAKALAQAPTCAG